MNSTDMTRRDFIQAGIAVTVFASTFSVLGRLIYLKNITSTELSDTIYRVEAEVTDVQEKGQKPAYPLPWCWIKRAPDRDYITVQWGQNSKRIPYSGSVNIGDKVNLELQERYRVRRDDNGKITYNKRDGYQISRILPLDNSR